MMATSSVVHLKGKHLLTLADFTGEEIEYLLKEAVKLKAKQKNKEPHPYLKGKTLAMIFEKASTRTRVSFEVGMHQLGGHALFLSKNDIQMGRGETIQDTAKILSGYVDGIMIRTFAHDIVEQLAAHSSIPIINGLTDDFHPCQVLADLLTIYEEKGYLAGNKLAYIGDGNNMAHSLMIGCAKVGIDCSIAAPIGYEPQASIVEKAKQIAADTGAAIHVTNDPKAAVHHADFVYTDVWASMGWEAEQQTREKAFAAYQVNQALMSNAKPNAGFLHCLPAHRGEEVTADIIDGPQSLVFQEAENRLHVQKALLAALLA